MHFKTTSDVDTNKIEKVPKSIQGEEPRKDTASSVKLVSTIGASFQKGECNQVSGRVSFPCWLATPVANAPWKPSVIRWKSSPYQGHDNWWKVWLVGKSLLVKDQNVIYHSWEGDFILLNKIPVSTINLSEWRFKSSTRYPCLSSLLESRLALRIKHAYEEQARA